MIRGTLGWITRYNCRWIMTIVGVEVTGAISSIRGIDMTDLRIMGRRRALYNCLLTYFA